MVLKKFSDIFKKDDIVYVDFSLSDSIAYDYFYPLEAKNKYGISRSIRLLYQKRELKDLITMIKK